MLAGSVRVLCGHFHAAFGDVVDMFGGLSTPIETYILDEPLEVSDN